ncbi:hypothetical protein ACFOU1_13390 [Microbacterium sp. GCM10011525]|uniref:hypothetical protein n=1 Tax=Microbacterium sp. MAH-37 TaxID=2682846 RepID=UPI0018DFD1A8|nr:hypothetical protein [Microbacterium sp. MAH-37]
MIAGFIDEPDWRVIGLSGNVYTDAVLILEDRFATLPDLEVEVRGREFVLSGEFLRVRPQTDQFLTYLRLAAEFNTPG